MVYVRLVKLPKNRVSLRVYLAVGIGGIIGATLRYLVSILFGAGNGLHFPWATFTVNMSGAFILSFILFHPKITNKISPIYFTALTTGIIGSYTTFSAITMEVVTLWQNNLPLALSYLFLTVVGGLLCSFGGYKVAFKYQKAGIEK